MRGWLANFTIYTSLSLSLSVCVSLRLYSGVDITLSIPSSCHPLVYGGGPTESITDPTTNLFLPSQKDSSGFPFGLIFDYGLSV